MKAISIVALLTVSFFLLAAGAAAESVKIQNVQMNTIGATVPVTVVLDTSSGGVAGYNITIHVSNASVATITDVSFPSWAVINESTTLPASSVRLRTLDLYKEIEPSATNIPFGSITLRGDAIGSTDIMVTIENITSDNGDSLTPAVRSGTITIESARSQPVIANHTYAHLSLIPKAAIDQARSTLHIAYGHTSHGSQVTDGMTGLESFPGSPYGCVTYRWNDGVAAGQLDLDDYFVDGDLGNPDYATWATRTRSYLNNAANSDVNVVMWSWCGEADTSEANINLYLNTMNQLESEYPDVTFVYMTGHLVGSGESGNLNQRNDQIRNYVRANNKVLYDFADIESFDPDGLINYMKLNANDNCDYDSNGDGIRDKNWATAWQASHIENIDWYDCSAAHSQALNGNQKAYAAWWLWARLGGWDGNPVSGAPVSEFTGTPVTGVAPLTVEFTDQSSNTPDTWNWTFGDGGVSIVQNPSHTYTRAGTYSVSLNVTNTQGFNNGTKTGYVVVTQYPATKIGSYKNGVWYLDNNGNGIWNDAAIDKIYNFGGAGNISVEGDWDGDGMTEIGVTNGVNWFLDTNGNGVWDGTPTDQHGYFGIAGYTPVTGDWDGDGMTEIGVTNGVNWFLDTNGNGVWDGTPTDQHGYFGIAGYTPVTGDWDGDGMTEIGVTNSVNWFLDTNGNGVWDGTPTDQHGYFGIAGYTPVTGDWDGDGMTEIGVTNSVNWFLDTNGNGVWDGTPTDQHGYFGIAGYTPVTGDWDGDGMTEIGVTNGVNWFLDTNGNGVWDGIVLDKAPVFNISGYTPIVGKWQ